MIPTSTPGGRRGGLGCSSVHRHRARTTAAPDDGLGHIATFPGCSNCHQFAHATKLTSFPPPPLHPPQLTRRGYAAICASFAESRINSTLKIKRLRLLYKNYVTGVMRNAQPSEHHPHRLMGKINKQKKKKSLPNRVTCQLNTKLKPDYSVLHTAGEHCSEMLDRSTERDGLYQAFRSRLNPPGCALD